MSNGVIWNLVLLLLPVNLILGQSISGQISDSSTQQPVPFANIYIQNTAVGTIADNDGNFNLQLKSDTSVMLVVLAIGYEKFAQRYAPNDGLVKITLRPATTGLSDVVVEGNKKVPKDTAAIRLYRRVVKNKPLNSIAAIRSYSFTEYDKTSFTIINVKDGIINRQLLKRTAVIRDYIDSTANGTKVLPVLLRERIREVNFTANPIRKKVLLTAERFDGVEDYYKWQITEHLFEEMDIYQNTIRIQNKGFISPFANNALPVYKYFIADTLVIQEAQYIVLEFTPRRKSDLAFSGSAIIHNETAAIYKVDVRLIPQANLNFIAGLELQQEYTQISDSWIKKEETFGVYLNLTNNRKHQNIKIVQAKKRTNISTNKDIEPTVFSGQTYQMEKGAWYRDPKYWDTHRPAALTSQESGIAQMLDTIKQTPLYKQSFWLAHAIRTGYLGAGPIEIGRWESLYSWNAIEGNRFNLGIKNNRFLFNQRYHFNTYLAYGDKDKLLKYYFWNEWAINKLDRPLWNAIGGYYRFDWSFDYNHNRWWSYDRIFQSIGRIGNPLNTLFLIREGNVYFEQEIVNGIFGRVATTHKTVYSWPSSYQFPDTEDQQFSVVDFHLKGKFSVASRTKEQRKTRSIVNFNMPYIEVNYHLSPKNMLGSDYPYHLLKLAVNQKLNSSLGQSIVDVKAGKLFGTVPFPLLEIHQGNESIGYNQYSYNLMNDYEFASDTWGELWLEHHFDGLIFNLIPWNKYLKIRSLVSFKALAGALTPANEQFLLEAYQLKPVASGYLEMGVGFENIARAIRIDLLWCITQRDDPNSRNFGIRWQFKPNF